MPFIILPGTVQLARSPSAETSIAPKTAKSICPPRTIAKLVDDEKKLELGSAVIVCFPALIRRSEQHTSELQSLISYSYAAFDLQYKITASNRSFFFKTQKMHTKNAT